MAGALDLPVFAGSTTPRITSLLVKPASALCNLDCAYCFYLDRAADPYSGAPARVMDDETLERLVDSFLFYSYPASTFAFQGGEPTLAGLRFYERLVELQKRYGRAGQEVSNAIQTNGILIDEDWCRLFREYSFLVGLSLDGPPAMHDLYRVNKAAQPTSARVLSALELMRKEKVEFNILCVLSQANVHQPRQVYQYLRGLGVEHIQFIPLAEFDAAGAPLPFTITAEQYGRFLCEIFELWWPERRKVRVRFFDNLAEAVAGVKPASCTLHETCDSYVVVEYNGDVYPCDFFVESAWKIGNIGLDSFSELARRQRRLTFALKKTIAHPECQQCQYQALCHGGCPKTRHAPGRRFEDLDYFCAAYKVVFERAVEPLRRDLARLYPNQAR
jgi:uncharacterized protein